MEKYGRSGGSGAGRSNVRNIFFQQVASGNTILINILVACDNHLVYKPGLEISRLADLGKNFRAGATAESALGPGITLIPYRDLIEIRKTDKTRTVEFIYGTSDNQNSLILRSEDSPFFLQVYDYFRHVYRGSVAEAEHEPGLWSAVSGSLTALLITLLVGSGLAWYASQGFEESSTARHQMIRKLIMTIGPYGFIVITAVGVCYFAYQANKARSTVAKSHLLQVNGQLPTLPQASPDVFRF